MNLRSMLSPEKIAKAVEVFGMKKVEEEIDEMIWIGLADEALDAAHALNNKRIATAAAAVVRNSGCYSAESKKLAEKYPQ